VKIDGTGAVILVAGAGLVGFAIGKRYERTMTRRRLLEGRVTDVAQVESFLPPGVAEYVDGLLEAGREVIQERVEGGIVLLARLGSDRFERIFMVPTDAEGTPQAPPLPMESQPVTQATVG